MRWLNAEVAADRTVGIAHRERSAPVLVFLDGVEVVEVAVMGFSDGRLAALLRCFCGKSRPIGEYSGYTLQITCLTKIESLPRPAQSMQIPQP